MWLEGQFIPPTSCGMAEAAAVEAGGLVLPSQKRGGKTPASPPMHSFGEEMGKGSTRGKCPFPSTFLGGWGLSKPRKKKGQKISIYSTTVFCFKKKEEENYFAARSPARSRLPGTQRLPLSGVVPGWARVVLRACFLKRAGGFCCRRFLPQPPPTPGAPSRQVLPPWPSTSS